MPASLVLAACLALAVGGAGSLVLLARDHPSVPAAAATPSMTVVDALCVAAYAEIQAAGAARPGDLPESPNLRIAARLRRFAAELAATPGRGTEAIRSGGDLARRAADAIVAAVTAYRRGDLASSDALMARARRLSEAAMRALGTAGAAQCGRRAHF